MPLCLSVLVVQLQRKHTHNIQNELGIALNMIHGNSGPKEQPTAKDIEKEKNSQNPVKTQSGRLQATLLFFISKPHRYTMICLKYQFYACILILIAS